MTYGKARTIKLRPCVMGAGGGFWACYLVAGTDAVGNL